jgi:hypothetical protein
MLLAGVGFPLLVGNGCPDVTPTEGTLKGTITNSATDTPLEGATVA